MSVKSYSELMEFYEGFRGMMGWDHLEAMRRFLPVLFRETDLDGCTMFTSHEVMCIVRYATYEQWVDKPCIYISAVVGGRLQISFEQTFDRDDVSKKLTETVNCPADRALSEFDKIYEKFVAAHK